MKCLSLWQPWASALFLYANGLRLKPDETRAWPTGYRGPLAIHAAKRQTLPGEDYDPELDRILRAAAGRTTADLPRGAIIGVVAMIDCRLTSVVRPRRPPEQTLWGNYEDADPDGKRRFAWTMATPLLLPAPILNLRRVQRRAAETLGGRMRAGNQRGLRVPQWGQGLRRSVAESGLPQPAQGLSTRARGAVSLVRRTYSAW